MMEILVISQVLSFLLAYKLFDQNLVCPSCLYIGGFTVCSAIAYIYRYEWSLGLHVGTCFLLVAGSLACILGECLYRRMSKYKNDESMLLPRNIYPRYEIAEWKLVVSLFFQLIVYFSIYKMQISFAGATTWADAISEIDQDNKYGDSLFKLPWYLNFSRGLISAIAHIWGCLLVFYLRQPSHYNRTKILLILNLIAAILCSTLSGGRMPILGIIVPILVVWYTMYKKQTKKDEAFNSLRRQIKLVAAILAFVFSFSQIGSLMGRHETDDMDASYVFAAYCGAEIKLLDNYIQSEGKGRNEFPIMRTFSSFYGFLNDRLGMDIKMKKISYDFQHNNGYFLGNVYTAYRTYYYDLGYWGFLFAGLLGFLASMLYYKGIKTDFFITGRLNCRILLFCFLSGYIFMSFFSELFMRNFFSVEYIVRTLIYFYVSIYFLQGRNKNVIS